MAWPEILIGHHLTVSFNAEIETFMAKKTDQINSHITCVRILIQGEANKEKIMKMLFSVFNGAKLGKNT